VVGNDGRELVEPEEGEGGEEFALVGDGLRAMPSKKRREGESRGEGGGERLECLISF
jgi:hypothetical protein